jgi:hypothetical protein
MKLGFPHRGAGGSAPGTGSRPAGPDELDVPADREDRACCCLVQPVVRAIVPPTPKRGYPMDLLLCGHHYCVSRRALITAGASIYDMPGKADAATAALLDVPQAFGAVT